MHPFNIIAILPPLFHVFDGHDNLHMHWLFLPRRGVLFPLDPPPDAAHVISVQTLRSKKKVNPKAKVTPDVVAHYGAVQSAPTQPLPPPAVTLPVKPISVRNILSRPPVRAVYATGALLAFLAIAFDVVFILFAYTAIDLGGLERTVSANNSLIYEHLRS
jgi:hypothetical protein